MDSRTLQDDYKIVISTIELMVSPQTRIFNSLVTMYRTIHNELIIHLHDNSQNIILEITSYGLKYSICTSQWREQRTYNLRWTSSFYEFNYKWASYYLCILQLLIITLQLTSKLTIN